MKIAINGQSLEGGRTGVGRVLLNVLRYWAQNKNHQFFIYFKNEIPRDLPKSENFFLKLTSQKSNLLFNQFTFPRAAKKDGCDLLFCPAYQIPILFGQTTVLIIHDIIYEAHPRWHNWNSFLEKILFRFIFKKSAQKATLIVVPSQETKKEIQKFYKIAGRKIKVLHIAADGYFKKIEVGENEKEKFGLKGKFILSVASIFTRRHPREVLAAFKLFAQKNKNWQLLMLGKDYSNFGIDKLSEEINRKLNRKAVLRINSVKDDKDLLNLYNLAHILIYLSDYEGFGLPVLEGMQCGTPVITSNKSSLKEVAGDATFLIADNNSVQEIFNAFKKLAENQNLRERLTDRGLARAKKFSWQFFAESILKEMKNVEKN